MTQSTPKIPAPNLLPYTRITSRRRQAAYRRWSFTTLAIILVIGIPSALLSIHLRTSKPAENDHATRFVADLEELQSSIPPLRKQLAKLEQAAESQKLAQTRILWTTVLNQLEGLANEHVRVHTFTGSIVTASSEHRIEINIQIHTGSLSQARDYLVSIEDSGLFDEVSMLDSRRQSSAPDSPVNSTIKASIIAAQPEENTQ